MMRPVDNERGIALAVAIFALVVIGALVAGAFYVGTQEQRVGRNTVLIQQALSAAEAGAYTQVSNWDAPTLNSHAAHGRSRGPGPSPLSFPLPFPLP